MNLNKLLGIEYPIIQGGMANISDGKFAAAVSNAGVLGTIGSGGMDVEALKREIDICRTLTDKPFAVNVVLVRPNAEEIIDTIIEKKVAVLITGAGNPTKFVSKVKAAGIKIFPVVSSPIQIQLFSRANVDGFIVEGMEAGGHIGEMPSMPLIYQARAVTDLPIIAAGGIGSGSQMFAAEVLGANGVQIGTGFLFTEECPIHENYKNLLIKSNSAKITKIGNINGLPMRLIKNVMSREYRKLEKSESNLEVLETYTLGRLKRAVYDGDVEEGAVMAGYTVGQFDKLAAVKEFISKLLDEYAEVKNVYKN